MENITQNFNIKLGTRRVSYENVGTLNIQKNWTQHYSGVIMSAIASQITRFTIVYSSVYSAATQRKHQSFAQLAFVRGIHRWPVNSPHKGPVSRNMFPFDGVIMNSRKITKSFVKWQMGSYGDNLYEISLSLFLTWGIELGVSFGGQHMTYRRDKYIIEIQVIF